MILSLAPGLSAQDSGKGRNCRKTRCEAAETLVVAPDAFGWVACDAMTTRSIQKSLRGHGLPKTSVKGRAYWK